MLSPQYHCIFVHQRKCAGTSIIRSFGYTPAQPEWHFANNGVLAPEWAANPAIIQRCFKFSVVRNPWERFVSAWRYLPATRNRSIVDVLRNPPAQGHDFRHITRPQHATLFDANGQLAVDLLIRYEDLDNGYRTVCQRIGKPYSPLPWLNRGERTPYQQFFDDEARALFEQRFGEDIRRFGYEFGSHTSGVRTRHG